MKKTGLIMSVFALLILSCGAASPPTSQAGSLATMVAATIQALTVTAPPPPAPTQASGVSITIGQASIFVPSAVASGAAGEQVAAVNEGSGAPWEVAPAHIEFTMQGYHNSLGKFPIAKIWVYPAKEYAAVNNRAAISLQRLKAFLDNPSMPIARDTLPKAPTFNAAEAFASNVRVLDFQSGRGVRMVTQYDQAIMPVANDATFYHFEGLTSDGKFYVVAALPIGSLVLQSSENSIGSVPAAGVPFPGFDNMNKQVFDTYIQAVTDKLNAQEAAAGFEPSLAQLDALIQSLTTTTH